MLLPAAAALTISRQGRAFGSQLVYRKHAPFSGRPTNVSLRASERLGPLTFLAPSVGKGPWESGRVCCSTHCLAYITTQQSARLDVWLHCHSDTTPRGSSCSIQAQPATTRQHTVQASTNSVQSLTAVGSISVFPSGKPEYSAWQFRRGSPHWRCLPG
jgi:hypothetical protein